MDRFVRASNENDGAATSARVREGAVVLHMLKASVVTCVMMRRPFGAKLAPVAVGIQGGGHPEAVALSRHVQANPAMTFQEHKAKKRAHLRLV